MRLSPKNPFLIFNKTICGIYRFIYRCLYSFVTGFLTPFPIFVLASQEFSRKKYQCKFDRESNVRNQLTTFSWNQFSSLQLHKSNKFYCNTKYDSLFIVEIIYHPISELNGINLPFFQNKVCDLNLSPINLFFSMISFIFFNKFFIEIVFTMSLILTEYAEPFSVGLQNI